MNCLCVRGEGPGEGSEDEADGDEETGYGTGTIPEIYDGCQNRVYSFVFRNPFTLLLARESKSCFEVNGLERNVTFVVP